MKKKRFYWVIWLVVLVLSAYIVPYVFIGNIHRAGASFLFWTLFAVLAIISTIKITTYWRE